MDVHGGYDFIDPAVRVAINERDDDPDINAVVFGGGNSGNDKVVRILRMPARLGERDQRECGNQKAAPEAP